MTYLNALIAAARGRPQGLQPRLASRFENAAPGNNPVGATPDAGPLPAPRPTAGSDLPPPTPHPDTRPALQSAMAPPALVASREQALSLAPTPPSVRAEPVEALGEPPFAKAAATRKGTPEAGGRGKPEAHRPDRPDDHRLADDPGPPVATEPDAPPAGSEPPWLNQPAPIPSAIAPPPVSPAVQRTAPAAMPPTIRVSIGRIDVRADPAPARNSVKHDAKPAAGARPAGDSALTRYLSQRGKP